MIVLNLLLDDIYFNFMVNFSSINGLFYFKAYFVCFTLNNRGKISVSLSLSTLSAGAPPWFLDLWHVSNETKIGIQANHQQSSGNILKNNDVRLKFVSVTTLLHWKETHLIVLTVYRCCRVNVLTF